MKFFEAQCWINLYYQIPISYSEDSLIFVAEKSPGSLLSGMKYHNKDDLVMPLMCKRNTSFPHPKRVFIN